MSSQQSTPFSYFSGNHKFGVDGKNIWSSNKDDEKYVGSGRLNEEPKIIVHSENCDKFIYKSSEMVDAMKPSGGWYVEIIDDKYIVFRRADDIVDIRPSLKLNVLMYGVLFMNIFYTDVLSYLLMFGLWSSILCINDPDADNINPNIHSWSSFIPQVKRIMYYTKDQIVYAKEFYFNYIETVVDFYDKVVFVSYGDNKPFYQYDETEDVDEDVDEDENSVCDNTSCSSSSSSSSNSSSTSYSSTSNSSMSSLDDYGISAEDEETNALYDELYQLHMNDENFIYWVKSGENGIISGEYFDEMESDENWLYAFAEMCYGGDISYEDVVRLFVTDTENFNYEDNEEDEDNDDDSEEDEDNDDDSEEDEDNDDDSEEDEEEDDDDEDWDKEINPNEFIRPNRGGMWLRSMR